MNDNDDDDRRELVDEARRVILDGLIAAEGYIGNQPATTPEASAAYGKVMRALALCRRLDLGKPPDQEADA
jgi:hypothetical protein